MTTVRLVMALLSVVVGGVPVVRAADAPVFDKAAYAAAVERARAGDVTVDYGWLRRQTAVRDHYSDAAWKDFAKAGKALDGDPAQALKLAEARLDAVWTDAVAHAVARVALTKLGKVDEARRHGVAEQGLMRSITDGRKGTGAQDAFNAVSVGEEYRTLVLMNWRTSQQALRNEDGHVYDVLTVTTGAQDGKAAASREVWFNIDAFFGKEFGF